MGKRLRALVRVIVRLRWWAILGLLGIAAGVVALTWHTARQSADPDTAGRGPVITHSTATPSESKTSAAGYIWQGRPTDPKRLVMPGLGVDSWLQPMGIDQHGQVAAPANIHLAGWFVRSAQPGERGLAVIDGHVNGPKGGQGVFVRLASVRVGDEFSVIRGDDRAVRYRVIAVDTVPAARATDVLFSQNPSFTSQLNLITCAGRFDAQSRQYADRTIVQAAVIADEQGADGQQQSRPPRAENLEL